MLIESNLEQRSDSLTQIPTKLKRYRVIRTNFSVKIESTSVFPKEFNSCRRRIMINSPNLLPRTSLKKLQFLELGLHFSRINYLGPFLSDFRGLPISAHYTSAHTHTHTTHTHTHRPPNNGAWLMMMMMGGPPISSWWLNYARIQEARDKRSVLPTHPPPPTAHHCQRKGGRELNNGWWIFSIILYKDDWWNLRGISDTPRWSCLYCMMAKWSMYCGSLWLRWF